jgi:predicted GNAT family acetyltransferase
LATGFASLTAPYIPVMPASVRNNAALSRFELDADGGTAVANYEVGDGVITFTHTEVPPAARQAGIGSRLIREALETVRTLGLKVIPRCSFVRDYLAKHREFDDLIA